MSNGVARSQRLVGWEGTVTGNSPVFFCPPGHVTLVKSGYFFNHGTIADEVHLRIVGSGGVIQLDVYVADVPVATAVEWQGWLCLHPDEYVYAWHSGDALAMWISGAILAGGPQFPPGELADPVFFPPAVGALPA